MRFYDNHNHSQFSFDGHRTTVEASARAALEAGLEGICFTDHCDFYVPQMKAEHEDRVPEEFDIKAQQEEIDRVSKALPDIRILKGIEIGMYHSCHKEIRKVLEENSFD
ncbi:MAG: PHP domain-containing protein, partial [Candidatus Cryptobacteroides sp.]